MADIPANSNLSDLLESIKDYDLNKRTYAAILKQMESKNPLQSSDFEKLLTLCLHEYKKKTTFGISCLKIISCLLKKVHKEHSDSPELVALLVAVLNNLKINVYIVKINALKALCFEIVMLFPDECLITAAGDYANELYSVVELYCTDTSVELAEQAILLISKLLQILPSDKKSKFVRDGINIWFSSLIPTIFDMAKENSSGLNNALILLLTLLKELLQHNYFENKHWKTFHSNLLSRYLPIISNILNDDREHWAPLWIVTVNLLKGGLTAGYLNALLQIEENAFKMDQKHRCLAFECWNSFIDNFTMHSNKIIKRRIKFLAVPLLSHNAKSEETVLAKFSTWWHFIAKLCSKSDDMAEYIEHFLMFCFGSPLPTTKFLTPGLFSCATKKLAIQALAKILGPCDCLCFGELKPLEMTLISAEHLMKHNKNWLHYFQTALDVCVELENEELSDYLQCAWRSYLLKIHPNEAFRKEQTFSKVLAVLQKSLQKCCFETSKIMMNKLLPAVFELGQDSLTMLFGCGSEGLDAMQAIFTDPCNNHFYLSCNVDKVIQNISLYTDYAVNHTGRGTLDSLLEKLPSSESGILLWTCFVESTMKYKYFSHPQWIINIIIWPIKQNIMSNADKYVTTWINLYGCLDGGNADNEWRASIKHSVDSKLLQLLSGSKSAHTALKLTSIVSLIKQDLTKKGGSQKPELVLLKALTKQTPEDLSPALYRHLLDALTMLLHAFAEQRDPAEAKKLLLVANAALKATPRVLSAVRSERKFLEAVELFLTSIYNLIKIEDYSKLSSVVLEGIKQIAFSHEAAGLSNDVKNIVLLLKTTGAADKDVKVLVKKISPEQSPAANKKPTPSKNIKKAVKIVNTVVEDGEEFVQIESDWKFNPKKMTENQKEKWQRKREDIPALYQDLSQSQDDIKLRTWKADSNDTTSSKSTNSAAFPQSPSEIQKESLKSLPALESPKATSKLKDANSPRIPLKDRVSRNVKVLLNKVQLNNKDVTQCLVVCEKIPDKTISAASNPSSTKEDHESDTSHSLLKSSSPLVTIERPSRRKKTPSKYNDSKIFGMRKRINLGLIKGETARITDTAADNTRQNAEALRKNSDDSLKLADDKESKLSHEAVDQGEASAPNEDVEMEKSAKENGSNESNPSSKTKKRSTSKESRIQKLLAINMVEPTITISNHHSGSYATRTKLKLTNQVKPAENESSKDSQPLPDSASQDVIESSQDSSLAAISAIAARSRANSAAGPSLDGEDKGASDSLVFEEDLLMSGEECDSLLPENNTLLQPNATTDEKNSNIMDAEATMLTEQSDTEPINSEEIQSERKFDDDSGDEKILLGFSAQHTAEADTQPVDFTVDVIKEEINDSLNKENELTNGSSAKAPEGAEAEAEAAGPTERRDDASSPLRDSEQRRRDFLDDTLEISPIRPMCSLVHERTPSPETSADFVLVNAESPEIFSEPKGPPGRGRAATMLGLCASPLQRSPDADADDDPDGPHGPHGPDHAEPFLTLRRVLPPEHSSPRGPILKRKRAELDAAAPTAPAAKRKRVSFHDPPVSTLVCVRKYIGPGGARSPPRGRSPGPKSQRRLDKILAKTVESILADSPDTPSTLSDRTPTAEVVEPAALDACDPIFPRLAACEDPIERLAADLASADTTRPLLEALRGSIATVGDLARCTELQVNRLSIKAPKLDVARRALQLHWDRSLLQPRPGQRADAGTQSAVASASASSQTEEAQRSDRALQTERCATLLQDSDISEYIRAKPEVIEALDDRSLEALSEALVSRLVQDKEKMAEIVIKFLKEKFEAKSAVSYWCEILQKITDSP